MANIPWFWDALAILIICLLFLEVVILKVKIKNLRRVIRRLEGTETIKDYHAYRNGSGDAEGRS